VLVALEANAVAGAAELETAFASSATALAP